MLNRTAHASANVARRRPAALPLPPAVQQPYRRAATLPQSPLQEIVMVGQSLMSPSGTSGVALSPTQLSPSLQLQQRIDNLTKCLITNVPEDITYPSLGQVSEEVKRVSTFLDLYRARARDDASLNKVKSPTPRETEGDWQTFDDVSETVVHRRRRTELRRSRSLEHMKRFAIVADIRVRAEMDDLLAQPAEPRTTIHDLTTTTTAVTRRGALEDAKTVILNSDAQKMAEFRKRFKNRPPALQLASVLAQPAPSLPSPPLPSALLKVKSPLPLAARAAPRRLPQPPPPALRRLPRPPVILAAPLTRAPSFKAPYWVKKVPKTPRTMRTERRHGWGGSWDTAGISQVVDQLKEA